MNDIVMEIMQESGGFFRWQITDDATSPRTYLDGQGGYLTHSDAEKHGEIILNRQIQSAG